MQEGGEAAQLGDSRVPDPLIYRLRLNPANVQNARWSTELAGGANANAPDLSNILGGDIRAGAWKVSAMALITRLHMVLVTGITMAGTAAAVPALFHRVGSVLRTLV